MAMRPCEKHLFDFGDPLTNMVQMLCRPQPKRYIGWCYWLTRDRGNNRVFSYLARRKYAEEWYDLDRNRETDS